MSGILAYFGKNATQKPWQRTNRTQSSTNSQPTPSSSASNSTPEPSSSNDVVAPSAEEILGELPDSAFDDISFDDDDDNLVIGGKRGISQISSEAEERPRQRRKIVDDDDDDVVRPMSRSRVIPSTPTGNRSALTPSLSTPSKLTSTPSKLTSTPSKLTSTPTATKPTRTPTRTPTAAKTPTTTKSLSVSSFGTGSQPEKPSPARRKQLDTNATQVQTPTKANSKHANEKRWWWLTEEKIRDGTGKRPGEEGYDASTIFVPPAEFAKLGPFERQYWEIKKNLWDTVVFFKKGKFYELYENDADIGHQVLELRLSERVNMSMVGVPEGSFNTWAAKLVAKGYKVARCEQMETLDQVNERKTKGSSREVCKRGLVQMYSSGTLIDPNMLGDHNAPYLLSLKVGGNNQSYGICFGDTTTGRFTLGLVHDTHDSRVQLEMLLLQIKPVEVLLERGEGIAAVKQLVKRCASDARLCLRSPTTQFWDTFTTTKFLEAHSPNTVLPEAVTKFSDNELVMGALGGLIQYLDETMVAKEILTMARFLAYDPATNHSATMILDGRTLSNLEILCNSEGGTQGSLLSVVDRCITPMGRRMFRQWLCHPLTDAVRINDRLNAVADLHQDQDLMDILESGMQQLPDLERFLARIHSDALCTVQAVMFENVSAKKLRMFVDVLRGFGKVSQMFSAATEHIKSHSISSTILARAATLGEVGVDGADEFSKALSFFRNAFDWDSALKDGFIEPKSGSDQLLDEAKTIVQEIEQELEGYLHNLKLNVFNDKRLKWKHTQSEKYQVDVPVALLSKCDLPSDFHQISQTQASRAYRDNFLDAKVAELEKAEAHRNKLLEGTMKRLFLKMDEQYDMWLRVIECVSIIDCLCSLAKASISDGVMCRPEIVSDPAQSGVKLTALRHPTASLLLESFVPNDTELGFSKSRTIVVTGPNMGGKSTLLRQVCLAVVMAQLGCYVPAESMSLSPVDRIFTRIGASDRIMSGQSTFMVELFETAHLMKFATPKSLVVLDELGRGTSTFDGYSIASAVLSHILERVSCLCLFATHYHTLTEEFAKHPQCSNFMMNVLVDNESNSIVHTYKFIEGVCPKSYGTNVAAMAGVPAAIVEAAQVISQQFEVAMNNQSHGVPKFGAPKKPKERPIPTMDPQDKIKITSMLGLLSQPSDPQKDMSTFIQLMQLWQGMQKSQ